MSEEKQNDQQTSNAVSVIEHAPEKIWIEMEAVQKCPPDFRTNRYIFRFPNAIYGGTVDLMFKIRLRLKQDADKGQFRKILFQEGRPFDLTGEKGIDPKIAHWVAGQNLNPDGTMAPMMQASKDKHGQLESVKMPILVPSFKMNGAGSSLTVTLPYRTLVAARSASTALVHEPRSGRYATFYQGVLDVENRMCLVIGFKPRFGDDSRCVSTGVLALLDSDFLKRLEILNREMQRLVVRDLQPGGLLNEMYGLYEEKGRRRGGGIVSQQIDPDKLAAVLAAQNADQHQDDEEYASEESNEESSNDDDFEAPATPTAHT